MENNWNSGLDDKKNKKPWYMRTYSIPKTEVVEAEKSEPDQNYEPSEEPPPEPISKKQSHNVSLSGGSFKKINEKFEFNKPASVSIKAEIPEDCPNHKIEFKLFSVYKDQIEDMAHKSDGHVKDGKAEAELKLFYNENFYNDSEKTTSEKVEYYFTASHKDLKEPVESERLELPEEKKQTVMARLTGLLFDTNKTFIKNKTLENFKKIRTMYHNNNPSQLLIVGHTDTTGTASVNDPLSLKRSESVAQFLNDDVEAWFKNYSSSVPFKERWGASEDFEMIKAMPNFKEKNNTEDPIRLFQKEHGLTEDGIAGPNTRRKLIEEYMQLDGTTLADGDFNITITTHGCGENFPLDDSGENLDSDAQDGKEDVLDRRVELFFFDKETGIEPPPPGKNSEAGSTQYPIWRDEAEIIDLDTLPDEPHTQIHLQILTTGAEEPLSDASFTLDLPDGQIQGVTDKEGIIKAFDVPPGDYPLKIKHDNATALIKVPTTTLGEDHRLIILDEEDFGS